MRDPKTAMMEPPTYDSSTPSSGDRLAGGGPQADRSFRMRLFGPFEAAIGGVRITRWRSRKTPLLLALLALRQGREVERSWLAGTLWPDSPEPTASGNLRAELNSLRAALGPASSRVVSPGRHSLRLELAGAEVDLLSFDQALARGDEASLELAVSVYGGPLLEGCAEEWVLQERATREQAYIASLEQLARLASTRGDRAAAIRWLRRALTADPVRETNAVLLMEALAEEGRFGEVADTYRELRHNLRSALNVDPDPSTSDLFHRIREKAGAPVPRLSTQRLSLNGARSRAPYPITSLIGRDSEVREIVSRLGQSRLVTLTGSGGIGKTRLAGEVARRLEDSFADGACYVELAALSDPSLVPQALLSALDLQEAPGRSIPDTLLWRLREADLLVVLDNCEHLIDAAAQLSDRLLKSCGGLRVLATSREPLGIPGEAVFRVPSLALPATECPDEGPVHELSAALQLFVERAVAAERSFDLTEELFLPVATICRRLDGIPLAIELAAARVPAMPVGEIAARLDDCFSLLQSRSRTALPRHQTLRALIDWSYELLTEPERTLLARLSVFSGGWTREAAEAVCSSSGVMEYWSDGVLNSTTPALHYSTTPLLHHSTTPSPAVLDLLGRLVEKSLISYEQRSGAGRYAMLETVRQYAAEKLTERGGVGCATERHQSYFLALAERAAPHFRDGSQLEWLDRLDPDIDNFRVALAHVFDRSEHGEAPATPQLTENERASRARRMCAALSKYWAIRGHLEEGRRFCERALDLPGEVEPAVQASALLGLNLIVIWQADWEEAARRASSGLKIARMLGDPEMLAVFLFLRSISFQRPDEQANALPYAEESVVYAGRSGVPWALGLALQGLGYYYIRTGDYDKAASHLRESVNVLRGCGDWVAAANSLNCLCACVKRGDMGEAEAICREALTLLGPRSDRRSVAHCLIDMGGIAWDRCEWVRAVTLLSAAESICTRIGDRKVLQEDLGLNHFHQSARTALGEAAYEAARAEGWQMTVEQAIDLALSSEPRGPDAD